MKKIRRENKLIKELNILLLINSVLNILKMDYAAVLSYGFPFLLKDQDILKVSRASSIT